MARRGGGAQRVEERKKGEEGRRERGRSECKSARRRDTPGLRVVIIINLSGLKKRKQFRAASSLRMCLSLLLFKWKWRRTRRALKELKGEEEEGEREKEYAAKRLRNNLSLRGESQK